MRARGPAPPTQAGGPGSAPGTHAPCLQAGVSHQPSPRPCVARPAATVGWTCSLGLAGWSSQALAWSELLLIKSY